MRRCWVTEEVAWLEQKAAWAGLKSIVMVEAEREVIGKAPQSERRYVISRLAAEAKASLRCVRGHWGVENSLHGVLDVAFREDACQIKEKTTAAKMATLRHIALNLLNEEKSCQRGVKGKRLKAGWNQAYLLKVLKF